MKYPKTANRNVFDVSTMTNLNKEDSIKYVNKGGVKIRANTNPAQGKITLEK